MNKKKERVKRGGKSSGEKEDRKLNGKMLLISL